MFSFRNKMQRFYLYTQEKRAVRTRDATWHKSLLYACANLMPFIIRTGIKN